MTQPDQEWIEGPYFEAIADPVTRRMTIDQIKSNLRNLGMPLEEAVALASMNFVERALGRSIIQDPVAQAIFKKLNSSYRTRPELN